MDTKQSGLTRESKCFSLTKFLRCTMINYTNHYHHDCPLLAIVRAGFTLSGTCIYIGFTLSGTLFRKKYGGPFTYFFLEKTGDLFCFLVITKRVSCQSPVKLTTFFCSSLSLTQGSRPLFVCVQHFDLYKLLKSKLTNAIILCLVRFGSCRNKLVQLLIWSRNSGSLTNTSLLNKSNAI